MSEERTAKRLISALLGEPKAPLAALPEMPEGIPELPKMLVNLAGLSDEVYGKYAFSREILRGKIDNTARSELTLQANECGREYAGRVLATLGLVKGEPKIADKLAAALGMKVLNPRVPTGTDHVTFAQFEAPDKISVFQDGLDKAAELLKNDEVRHVLGDIEIREILLAHELFHCVEEAFHKEIFTRTYKIELWAPWPLHNRSTVRCLGEIAGMAFARELLGLSYSPFVLDVFLVYGYHPVSAGCLYQEIMEL